MNRPIYLIGWHQNNPIRFSPIINIFYPLGGSEMSKTTMTDGSPVYPDHRQINPKTGMQKGYVVLSDEERDKGFIRPIRNKYIHLRCGAETVMGQSIAETYARDPNFYSGTYCVGCKSHFPIGENGEFVWSSTGSEMINYDNMTIRRDDKGLIIFTEGTEKVGT